MERKKSYLCDICNNQLKINHGEKAFTFNIECVNGHKAKNVYINDLLLKSKINENIYQCEKHNKILLFHCFECNKDICLYCLQDLHKNHKNEFLKRLKKDKFNNIKCNKKIIDLEKMKNNFLYELNKFENEFIKYLKYFKSLIEKEYELIYTIVDFDNKRCVTSIDIENINIISDLKNFDKNIELFRKISFCNSFPEKLDYFKNIFINELKNRQDLKISDKYKNLYEFISKQYIPIPSNKNYYIEGHSIYNKEIKIIKDNSDLVKGHFNYETIFSKKDNSFSYKIIFDENKIDIEKELSFFCILHSQISKIIIKNLNGENKKIEIIKFNSIINLIEESEYIFIKGFIPMSRDKNIIFKSNGKICLFNNSFDNETLIKINHVYHYFKINSDTFVYSNKNNIYIMEIGEKNIEKKIKTKDNNLQFLYYYKDKKILFCLCI